MEDEGEGDNRTPGKTIGEVKYAQDRSAHAKAKAAAETRASDKSIGGVNDATNSSKEKAAAGDNRTPEKTIGEVKYAQDRSAPAEAEENSRGARSGPSGPHKAR